MDKKEENDLKTNHPLSSALDLLDLVIPFRVSCNGAPLLVPCALSLFRTKDGQLNIIFKEK